jgi:hypothetical protein
MFSCSIGDQIRPKFMFQPLGWKPRSSTVDARLAPSRVVVRVIRWL